MRDALCVFGKKGVLLCCCLPFLYLLFSFSGQTYTPDSPPPADIHYTFKNIAYGPDPRNIMDVALPKGRSTQHTPLIVFIHGGAWVLGNKLFFRREMEMFADSGFACACIDYRYVNNQKQVHHKEITGDILLAIDYIAQHSKGWNISPDRVGLMGHSAGGHMSMIVAYTLNADKRIKAVVSWSGPTNFIDPRQPSGESSGENILSIYTGTPLRTASDTVVWKSVSPYFMVQSTSVPTLLVQGEQDNLVPAPMAIRMKSRLDSLGVVNDLLLLKKTGHIYVGSSLDKARKASYDWMKQKL
jgi:acetyl esterase/lipase